MNQSALIDSKVSLDAEDVFNDVDEMIERQLELYVEHNDPNRTMARFYAMHISYSLFGEPCLFRQWGRIGTSGQDKLEHFEHEADAIRTFLDVVKKKQARGYTPRKGESCNVVKAF